MQYRGLALQWSSSAVRRDAIRPRCLGCGGVEEIRSFGDHGGRTQLPFRIESNTSKNMNVGPAQVADSKIVTCSYSFMR
jgi:hypothetical protein